MDYANFSESRAYRSGFFPGRNVTQSSEELEGLTWKFQRCCENFSAINFQ